MRLRSTSIALLILSLAVAPALASMGGGTPPPQPPPSPPPSGTEDTGSPDQVTSRQEASHLYADAYDELGKAKRDLEDGKEKNAVKRFKRALERGERVVQLDPKYHEAWNLVGYSARKLRDYDKALAAYDRCLSLKPDYAPAREYLGEAYLELGNAKKAREQLVMLEHLNATGDAAALKSKIEAYEAAHPDSAHPGSAPSDSAAVRPAGGSGQ